MTGAVGDFVITGIEFREEGRTEEGVDRVAAPNAVNEFGKSIVGSRKDPRRFGGSWIGKIGCCDDWQLHEAADAS